MWLNIGMSEKSYPSEANDLPIKRSFYPESLRRDDTTETDDFLPDPGRETGSPGDLGGGYNSLEAGQITPPKPENRSWPNSEEKATGLKGVQEARRALEDRNSSEASEENPS